MSDYFNPVPDPMGPLSHQELWNFGVEQANAGIPLSPQMPFESYEARMARENGYAAEQRRLAELRKMQGGY